MLAVNTEQRLLPIVALLFAMLFWGSSYINLIPVFAVVLGFIVLGESFTRSQLLASLLVIIGVITSQWGERLLRTSGSPI